MRWSITPPSAVAAGLLTAAQRGSSRLHTAATKNPGKQAANGGVPMTGASEELEPLCAAVSHKVSHDPFGSRDGNPSVGHSCPAILNQDGMAGQECPTDGKNPISRSKGSCDSQA